MVQQVESFGQYLSAERGKELDAAVPQDVRDYIAVLEVKERHSSCKDIRALALYYKFSGNDELASFVSAQREAGIAKGRASFPLREFLGIDPLPIQHLAALGILNAEQMLTAGATPEKRAALAQAAGVTEPQILELVKLSDLSRLAGVKAIRARL